MLYEAARKRFLAKTRREGDCLIWTGAIDKETGYGRFRFLGKVDMAHRVSQLLFNGPIPDGFDVCHSCDVRPCVESSHLWPGTRADNMQDYAAKGRWGAPRPGRPFGERNGQSKLTGAQVLEIRQRLSLRVPWKVIMRDFDICRDNLASIRNRKTWAHLTVPTTPTN